ncbi:MAG: cyclic nucleotide-binding domain-containing protein [Myxococcales bacterium]|nr:cyclic nucleotide-binding domain-containing protein [Myxococcales bacterium]
MSKDDQVRELRQRAAAAREKGRLAKALEAYLELERLEPRDPSWAQRAAECHRQLGQAAAQQAALERAAAGFAERGFTLKAVAVCKMILALDPNHTRTQEKLAELQGQRVRGLDRLQRSAPMPLGTDGPVSSPRSIRSGAPLDAMSLRDAVPGSMRSPVAKDSGAYEIHIEEIEYFVDSPLDPGAVLESLPLFRSLSAESLKLLIEHIELVDCARGQVVFEKGDAPDALYIIADGRVVLWADAERSVELGRLESGAVLGVVGVLSDDVRPHTAVALDECKLLKLSRITVTALVEREPEVLNALLQQVRERLVSTLTSTHPLFTQLAPDERQDVVSRFRLLEVPRGAVLVTEAWISPGLFLLLTGKAAVVRGSGSDRRKLGTLTSGAIFGEASLLSSWPAPTSVECETKCFVLVLGNDEFKKLAMTDPRFLDFLSEYAERRRRELEAVLDGGADFSEGRVSLV